MRFKLDTDNPNTMTEEIIQTIGTVEDFCVNSSDHTVSYTTQENGQMLFARTAPAPSKLPKTELNLSAKYPEIEFFTTVVRFGQYIVCSGVSKTKSGELSHNQVLLIKVENTGVTQIVSELKIDTQYSRIS